MQIVAALFFLTALGLGLATITHMVSAHFDRILDALALRAPRAAPATPAPSAEIVVFPRRMTVHLPERLAA